MSDLRLKRTKFNFGWGFIPDPNGGPYCAPPDLLATFKRPTLREGNGWRMGRERWGNKGEGRGGDPKLCYTYSTETCLQCFDAVGWMAGRASALQKTDWRGASVVICLQRDANDLHMVQLMLLQPHHICFRKSRMVYPAYPGCPGKKPLNCCVWLYLYLTVLESAAFGELIQ